MITLNTTIWEGDFDKVLDEKSWFLNYQNELVKEKTLIINNIKKESLDRLKEKIAKAQKRQKINIIYVNEVKEEAKRFFNLDINESTLGYYYTIQYFVSILKCNQPYIFNVSADCDVFLKDDFFTDSIDALLKDPRAIATTLSWKQNVNVGLHEQNEMFKKFGKTEPLLENFYYSAGFSDQIFLGDVKKLKKINYNIKNKDTDHFPKYGGECFEKRLCSYLLTEHSYRLVYKKYYYIHNMPKPIPIYKKLLNKIKKLLKIKK